MTAYMITPKGRDRHDKLSGREGRAISILTEFMKPGETGIVEHGENMLYYKAGGGSRGFGCLDETAHRELNEEFAAMLALRQVVPLTDVEFIKSVGKFTWGIPTVWHQLGNIDILEFQRYELNEKNEDGSRKLMTGKNAVQFHVFIDGRDTCHSFYSLDSAAVGAIGYKREGPNSRAAGYFDNLNLRRVKRSHYIITSKAGYNQYESTEKVDRIPNDE